MRLLRTLLPAVVVAAGLSACGTAEAPVGHGRVRPEVVTDDWALGRLAAVVGGGTLTVVDTGQPPPSASFVAVTSPRSSSAFNGAASTYTHHVAFTGDALVPADLSAFAATLAGELTTAYPADGARWRDGLAAAQSQLHSLTGDVETSLQSCPRRTAVVDGHQLDGLLRIGDVATTVVDAATPAAAAAAAARSAGTVFALTGADATALRSAARTAGAKVVAVATLATRPAGAPASTTYADALETDLAALTKGLGCPLEQ